MEPRNLSILHLRALCKPYNSYFMESFFMKAILTAVSRLLFYTVHTLYVGVYTRTRGAWVNHITHSAWGHISNGFFVN